MMLIFDAPIFLFLDEGYIPMTARLSLLDQPPTDSSWAPDNGAAKSQNSLTSQQETDASRVPVESIDQGPAYGVSSHPWTQQPSNAQDGGVDEQGNDPLQPEQPVEKAIPAIDTGVDSPTGTEGTGPIAIATPSSAQDIVEPDSPKPDGSSLYRASSSVYESDMSDSREPGLPARTSNVGRSPLAQREDAEPSDQGDHSESKTETGPQNEKRAETYSIRHVNWKHASGELRRSPILVQNKNGPCPLLALVNSLVLNVKDEAQSPITKALHTREHISLGLLIEALFDELATCLGPDGELPDIEELSRFLTMLHTGMNVNPRLTLVCCIFLLACLLPSRTL